MSVIGYSSLKAQLNLSAFETLKPARLATVTSVTPTKDALLVPLKIASKIDSPLSHLLFALKHEGVNLQILSQALRKISAQEMLAEITKSPTGEYIRVACFLWEAFNKVELEGIPTITGIAAKLFDPEKYITGPNIRNSRWRVDFNGLGSINYCVTVERTTRIRSFLEINILQKANQFVSGLGSITSDRAMSWAYLSETKSSFEIEHQIPSDTKAEAFVELLKKAHLTKKLDEEYLVGLQNTTISNPLDQASCYRHEQNWLGGPMRGAAGVTYVPPPPQIVHDLMSELIQFTNNTSKQIDPLIAAAVVSFGFVFIHPFMDGNGRLSRFLYHHTLCQSGLLKSGFLLPVSIAMKRHEDGYLSALKSFSEPARNCWEVIWIDGDEYRMNFISDESIYRYWDATACVEFGLEMANEALEKDLKDESEFLKKYDFIYSAINDVFDVRGKDLNALILSCIENNGKISINRRKKFSIIVQEEVFDAIENEFKKYIGLN